MQKTDYIYIAAIKTNQNEHSSSERVLGQMGLESNRNQGTTLQISGCQKKQKNVAQKMLWSRKDNQF